jgi:hypothetical protein
MLRQPTLDLVLIALNADHACLRRQMVYPSFDKHLIEEAQDLACNVLPPRLLVIHDASASREDNKSELTRWEKFDYPFFHIAQLDVVAGADGAGLVDAAVELDDNLAVAMVVDFFEFADVAGNQSVCRERK